MKKLYGRFDRYIRSLVDPTKNSQNDLWINAYIIWFTAAGLVFGGIFFVAWLIF